MSLLHVVRLPCAGAGLCDEAAVRFVVENGPDAVRGLMDLGVRFDKSERAPGYDLGREGGHSQRRVRRADGVQPERLGCYRHALVREHLDIGGMRDGGEPYAVQVQHFLELVGDPQLEPTVHRLEPIARDPHVLNRIRVVVDARPFAIPHFTRAEKVGQELEPFAVPREQERARGRFAIEFFHREW